jgi:maleate isomerase
MPTAKVLRVGVLTPHAATGPEEELPAMAPGRVLTCVARVSADDGANPTTPAGLPTTTTAPPLDETVVMLGRGSLDVIAYASTSSAYVIGFDAEGAVVSRLSQLVGTPVLATCASAADALRVLGVHRIALVHPPWFDAELNELGAVYFQRAGFDVLSSTSAAGSQDPDRIDVVGVCEWTARHVSDDAEAVFIGGNGYRVVGAIAALEAAIGRPVLTSNQVLLWNVMAHADTALEVSGYGRLFARGL